jgi:hypothetical protein
MDRSVWACQPEVYGDCICCCVSRAVGACLDCHFDQHAHAKLRDMEQVCSVNCTLGAYRRLEQIGHVRFWYLRYHKLFSVLLSCFQCSLFLPLQRGAGPMALMLWLDWVT